MPQLGPLEVPIHLYGASEISLITIGDSAFPRHPWLLKGYNEGTTYPQQSISIKSYAVHALLPKMPLVC